MGGDGRIHSDRRTDDLSMVIRWLFANMDRPLTVEPGTGRTRVSIEASSTIAVSQSGTWNIGTVTSLTQLATYDAKMTLLSHQEETVWQLAMRNRITIS